MLKVTIGREYLLKRMSGKTILCPGFWCDRVNPEIQHRQRQGPAVGMVTPCSTGVTSPETPVSSVTGLWDQRVTEKLH